MVMTASTMLPLQTPAFDFTLPDSISEQTISLADARGETGTVIMFICNHCPFVKHIIDDVAELADDYLDKGIRFIAISANDIETYPQDSPEKMAELAQEKGFSFPYLFDETQEIAKAYQAACTPDFYLFDQDLKCVYRGQFDDSRPSNHVPVTGSDLRASLDNLLAGKPINNNQKPSNGCNIKWKKDVCV